MRRSDTALYCRPDYTFLYLAMMNFAAAMDPNCDWGWLLRRFSMPDAMLHAPIACPECAKELLTEFRAASLAQALATGETIRLFASCHHKAWTASSVEREQLRAYLDAAILSGSLTLHPLSFSDFRARPFAERYLAAGR